MLRCALLPLQSKPHSELPTNCPGFSFEDVQVEYAHTRKCEVPRAS